LSRRDVVSGPDTVARMRSGTSTNCLKTVTCTSLCCSDVEALQALERVRGWQKEAGPELYTEKTIVGNFARFWSKHGSPKFIKSASENRMK
jgi:hypothetical protein